MLLTSVNKGLVNGHFPNISLLITGWSFAASFAISDEGKVTWTTEGSCSVCTRSTWTVAVVSTAGTLVNIYKTQDAKMWNQNGFLYKGKTLAVHSKSIKQKSSPVQVFPSPEYPSLQAHTYNPTVLRHTALTSQLWELVEHSSISGRKSEKTWGAYHLTEKSGWGVESIMVSDLPVYRRNATSVTVWIQKKGEFV